MSETTAEQNHNLQLNELQASQLQTSQLRINESQANQRLDLIVAQAFSEFSRSQLQKWIESGNLRVNNQLVKAKYKVKLDDLISLQPQITQQIEDEAEDIHLNIVYEDDEILVIDKPAGLVMHPAAGHASGTLLNALLNHAPQQKNLARAGIVHRLDKDTSGILVVAKTLRAQKSLVEQLQDRSLGRIYQALVWGSVAKMGALDFPIGRSEKNRKKQAVTLKGKPALTHYKKLADYGDFSLVECKLATGRTHQIRVHFAHIKHPLIGDKTYGRSKISKNLQLPQLAQLLHDFPRQALHAKNLHLIHPASGELMEFSTPIAQDLQALLDKINNVYDQQLKLN